MSTSEPDLTLREGKEIRPRRLWFGFIAGAVAWVVLGCADIVFAWRFCMTQSEYGIPAGHYGAWGAFFGVAVFLLALSIVAGLISYRNLRQITEQKVLDAQGVPRREFMALGGLIVTVTMGMGILWLALPPLFLDLCWRAR